MDKNNNQTYFNPDVAFFTLPIVKLTAFFFMAVFLTLCFVIIYMSKLSGNWNFTYSGFNNLLEYFKVPLGFLALTIPVGAIYAANHRSEQTKQQLALTRQQNLFTNYYKHIEEFEKFTSKRLESVLEHVAFAEFQGLETTAFDTRHYHKALFPNLLSAGTITVDRTLICQLEKNLNIKELLKAEGIDTLEKADKFFLNLLKDTEKLLTHHKLSIGRLMITGFTLKRINIKKYKKTQLSLLGKTSSKRVVDNCCCYSIIDSIERIQATLKILDTCFRFDTSYETMKCLQYIERLQTTIKMTGFRQLNMNPNEAKAKILKLELFSEDETPEHVPYIKPEDRVCPRVIQHCIKYSINDLINQYEDSTDDSLASPAIA